MSAYQELLTYTRQLERRLAKQERQESGGYTKSEADTKFLTILDAADTYIDISAYGDFLLATGAATGAQTVSQLFSRGIIAGDGVWGSEVANGDLILEGTTDATKTSSYVILQPTSGNVGIGTSAPSTKLHIAGAGISAHTTEATSWAATTNASSKLDLTTDAANVGMAMRVAKGTERYTTNATTVGFLQYGSSVDQFELVHGTNTRITVSSTGNVGIGAAPGEKLDVNGNILIPNNNFYKAKNAAGTAIQLLGIDGSDNVFMGAVGNAGGAVYIREDGSNVITITGSNVGIGTTTVPLKLSILTGITTNSVSTPAVLLGSDSTTNYASIDSVRGSASGYIGLAFSTANNTTPAEAMRIGWDGNVGIGTNNPGTKLHVSGGDVLISNARYYYAQNTSNTLIRLAGIDASNNVYLGAIDNAGGKVIIREDGTDAITLTGASVGIGTGTPAEKLHVAGDIAIDKRFYTTYYGNYVNFGYTTWFGYFGLNVYADGAGNLKQATTGYSGRSTGMKFADDIEFFHAASAGGVGNNITPVVDMRIDYSTGHVGIGTGGTASAARLQVAGGDVLIDNNKWYKAKNTGGTVIELAGIDGSNNVYLGAISNAGGKVIIREDGSDVITLHGSNVGIGTTSPVASAKLQVEGKVGVKTGVNAIDAQMMVYQDSSTGTCAVVDLVQEDVSEEFINFRSAVGASQPIDTAALGTYYGKVRVAVNGTFKFLALYNS